MRLGIEWPLAVDMFECQLKGTMKSELLRAGTFKIWT